MAITGTSVVAPLGARIKNKPLQPDAFNSFKDAQGRFRTQSLFIEFPHDSYPAYFTTKKYDVVRDGKTYLSLYLKYMEIADPTEYQVAIRLFGSWDHWNALSKGQWFLSELTGWREELKVRLESDRYFEMKSNVGQDGPASIQATKWLAERYGEKETAKRGRPSNAEREAHLKRVTDQTSELDDDAKRIGIV